MSEDRYKIPRDSRMAETASCLKDPNSPKISYLLWTDVTFVNFKLRRYITLGISTVQELHILDDLGYTAIDTAIADAIMRLNSTPGIETRVCCSGHPKDYTTGYIGFSKITPEILERMSRSKYWKMDRDKNNVQPYIFRLHPVKNSYDWLRAMLELHQLPGLANNSFAEYELYYDTLPDETTMEIVVSKKRT